MIHKQHNKVLGVFVESTLSVLKTITDCEVRHISTAIKDDHLCEYGLTGILDFSSHADGTAALSLPKNLAKRISRKLTGLDKKELNESIIQDALGELIKQVTGAAKTKLDGTDYGFILEIPRVVKGIKKNFTTKTDFPCIIMKFEMDGVEISLLLVFVSADGKVFGKADTDTKAVLDEPGTEIEEELIIDDDLQEIVDGFIIESNEYLEQIEQDLVSLESSHEDRELVGAVFRAFHTLKGNSRGLGFEEMEFMVHRTEDVIRKVQDGEMNVSSEMIDAVFKAVDCIKELLQDIKDRKKRKHDHDHVVENLRNILGGKEEDGGEEDLIIDDDLQEIVDGFVVESDEYLEQLDQDLVQLDERPDDLELVGNVFRIFHTLKGNSRGLGFEVMERMVHKTEDVIRKVRDRELDLTSSTVDVIFKAVDMIKLLLLDVKERKKRPRDLAPIVAQLQQVLKGKSEGETEETLEFDDDMKVIVEGFIVETEELLSQLDQDLVSLEESPKDSELVNTVFRALHTLKGNSRALGFKKLEELDHKTEDVIRKVQDGKMKIRPELMDVVLRSVDSIKLILIDIKKGLVSKVDTTDIKIELKLVLDEKYDELKSQQKKVQAAAPAPAGTPPKRTAATTIRVDVGKLDTLIDLTGELVLNKNRLLNFTQLLEQGLYTGEVEEFLNELNAQIGFLVSDLQQGVMSTRMQPIGKVFSKYPRVVRDLAREAGKEIDMIISGEDTELDNTIVEEIGDPLIHMVRNSCDHGIETPDVREAQGKYPKGSINLSAFYEGNFAVIEIRDDGKGIDAEIIKQKGIDKGLITEQQAQTMAKGDILNMIFLPGFSTAEKVTAVSGRGVGMDVVKNSIAKLNGIIELDSEPGEGTVVKIKLPLTLATMVGLEVEIGPERYLIPQDAIVEIIKVPKSVFQITLKEKKFLFRNKYTLPLLHLKDVFRYKQNGSGHGESGYIIVIGEVEKRAGLLVDNVLQQHEVVIKPLGTYVNNFAIHEVNGATIMGDGSIELIVNCNHLMALGQKIEV